MSFLLFRVFNMITIFLVRIHHGVTFTKYPYRQYMDGQTNYVDCMLSFHKHESKPLSCEVKMKHYTYLYFNVNLVCLIVGCIVYKYTNIYQK